MQLDFGFCFGAQGRAFTWKEHGKRQKAAIECVDP